MTKDQGCGCGSVFLINLITFGTVLGIGGYIAYKLLNKKLEEIQEEIPE